MKADLKNILLVEDDPDIQTVAAMVLGTLGGFEVSVCDSGGDAVARCRMTRPDIVLLDVMMPGMDGPSTLHALRELPGMDAVPVVFMTARAQPDEIARYRDLGVADVIVKPFDPMTLTEQVRAIWNLEAGRTTQTTRSGMAT